MGQRGAEVSLDLAQVQGGRGEVGKEAANSDNGSRCWRASDSPGRRLNTDPRPPASRVLVLGSGEGSGGQHVNKPLPHSGGGQPHFGGPEGHLRPRAGIGGH